MKKKQNIQRKRNSPNTTPSPSKAWEKAVGIDIGVKNFVTTSKVEFIEHPKFLQRLEKSLKRKQKKLSRKENCLCHLQSCDGVGKGVRVGATRT